MILADCMALYIENERLQNELEIVQVGVVVMAFILFVCVKWMKRRMNADPMQQIVNETKRRMEQVANRSK